MRTAAVAAIVRPGVRAMTGGKDDAMHADGRDALLQAIEDSPSYRLAHEDLDLLASDDLRAVRLQLELLKPERQLQRHNVRSTVVVLGSARLLSPAQTRTQLAYARYYDEARRFAEIVSRRFQQEGRCDFVVVTGGGPGIMEAANRGAFDAGARSIGLNVTLPHEQQPNPFITPGLAFRFRYFALRKMHFLLRARALVAFPGGFGTLDELFEVLTLVQTGKMPRIPIVLVGSEFWSRAVNFKYLEQEGFIDAEDLQLFACVDTAEEIISVLHSFYGGRPPVDDAARERE